MLSALMEIWVWLSPWRSVHWDVEIVPCTRIKSNSFLFPLFRKSAMQREEDSPGLLLWSFLLLRRSFFLLVGSLIELGGYQQHSLMLDTFLIAPFLRLEVTFHGEHCTLGELVEWLGVLVLTPCFHVDESRYAVIFLAVLIITAEKCSWLFIFLRTQGYAYRNLK